MDKILSVIIPTYNMEKYLDKCLTSLIISDKELMKQLEVLVIIDGAKDRSSEIAHFYQDKFPDTFRVIDKENGNYGSCINRGLKEATGKYVKVLDADDYYDTKILQSYIFFLSDLDVDLVLNDYCRVNEKGRLQMRHTYDFPLNEFTIKSLDEEKIVLLCQHMIAYKRAIFSRFTYKQTEGISYTDQEWCFLPVAFCKSISYFKHELYQYLVGREGQTMDRSVMARTINQQVAGTKVMIEEFVAYIDRVDPELRNYLKLKLKDRIQKLFYHGVRNWNNEISTSLNDIYNMLKSNTETNSIVGEVFLSRHVKYKVIEECAKRDFNQRIPYLFLLLANIDCLFHSILIRIRK